LRLRQNAVHFDRTFEDRLLRKMIEGRDSEIARLNATLQQTQTERAVYHTRLQKAEAELATYQQEFSDKLALRSRISELKRQPPLIAAVGAPPASSPTVTARANDKGANVLAKKVDRKATGYYMQIQPDGTLKLVPPVEAVGSTPK
jgi:hypothetical protein